MTSPVLFIPTASVRTPVMQQVFLKTQKWEKVVQNRPFSPKTGRSGSLDANKLARSSGSCSLKLPLLLFPCSKASVKSIALTRVTGNIQTGVVLAAVKAHGRMFPTSVFSSTCFSKQCCTLILQDFPRFSSRRWLLVSGC